MTNHWCTADERDPLWDGDPCRCPICTAWAAKLAAIDAERNRNKILRGGPLSRALLAMAEMGI